MSLFEIDIDDSFNFYCPITGSQILGSDFYNPSAATAFTFSPEAGDFESIEEPYRTIWDEIDTVYGEDEFGADLWSRFCERLHQEFPSVVVFGFTTHGMACGPVSITIFIAIDFAYGSDGEEDEGVE